MKKKGFTLIELLVVISIIALLMAILMPALARVRQIAYRVVCGHNLKGIGIALAVYAHDDDSGRYPRAGGQGSTLSPNQALGTGWEAATEAEAFGTPGQATLTSCFWLLVKGGYTQPAQFVCKSDTQVREFKLWDKADSTPQNNDNADFGDVWDFGDASSYLYCSYSYHMPFRRHAASSSSQPGIAVAADRNPFITSEEETAVELALDGSGATDTTPLLYYWDHLELEGRRNGNSPVHQRDGQNVLFNDGHIDFEGVPFCGVNEDNIYTQWATDVADQKLRKRNGISPSISGTLKTNYDFTPQHRDDSVLLNEEFPPPI